MHEYSTERQERFMALIEPVYDKLERFCRAITRNSDEAKDVLGETLLQAFQGFESVRSNTAFLSFLFTIASRVHKKRVRRTLFRRERDKVVAQHIIVQTHAPDMAADIALLYDAIRQLPDKQREAIILFELLDLPLEEVQRIQGGGLSALKVRLVRARKKLAAMLRTSLDTTAAESVARTQTPSVTFSHLTELL